MSYGLDIMEGAGKLDDKHICIIARLETDSLLFVTAQINIDLIFVCALDH